MIDPWIHNPHIYLLYTKSKQGYFWHPWHIYIATPRPFEFVTAYRQLEREGDCTVCAFVGNRNEIVPSSFRWWSGLKAFDAGTFVSLIEDFNKDEKSILPLPSMYYCPVCHQHSGIPSVLEPDECTICANKRMGR